jgi:hypothetical protein
MEDPSFGKIGDFNPYCLDEVMINSSHQSNERAISGMA